MRYEDFVVHIGGRRDDGYTVRVLQSPAGEGVGRWQPPITGTQVAAFHDRYRHGTGTREAFRPPLSAAEALQAQLEPAHRDVVQLQTPVLGPSAQDVGQRLFDSIFTGQVARLYDRSLGQLEDKESVGLRLKLRLDAEALADDELEGLPWELMYREETGRFLGLDRFTSIVRYLDVPRPPKPIPLPAVLRVLVVMAEPRGNGLASLNLAAECERLQELAEQHENWQVEVLTHASVSTLRRRLSQDEPYHVIHFMGHGGFDPTTGAGLLFFEQPDGSPQPISGLGLAAKLIDFDDLGLVFLNACETANALGSAGRDPFAGVASALVRGGVPAVIAMQRPISDHAAIAFSDAFYRRLAQGACADEALVEGRQAIHSADAKGVEWMIPVLFARIRDGALFETKPTLESQPRSKLAIWMLAFVILLLASFALTPVRNFFFKDATSNSLTVGKVFATTVEGVEGTLREVIILPDGTMRMLFAVTNASGRDQQMSFDFSKTYLADEQGHPYEVLGSSSPLGAPVLRQTLSDGETQELWIDVPAPLDGARRFGVSLAGAEGSALAYPYFEVELPQYPGALSRQSHQPEIPEGVEIFRSDVALGTSLASLDASVARIEMKPGESMRWNLAMINRSAQQLGINFDIEKVVVVDDLGNVYRSRGYGLGGGQQYLDGFRMRRGLRSDPWFDFDAPRPGATTFSLRLATKASSSVSFEKAAITLEALAGRSGIDEIVRPPNLLAKPVAINTSVASVEAQIIAIEKTPEQRMRWRLRLTHNGDNDLTWGLDYPKTYISDSQGRRYSVQAAMPAANVRRSGFRTSLISGSRSEPWIDVDAPFADADALTLRLASAMPRSLSFEPATVNTVAWPLKKRRQVETPPPGALRLAIDQPLGSTASRVIARLESADLFEGDRMRLNIGLLNGGDSRLQTNIDLDQLQLTDDTGRSYRLVGASKGNLALPGLLVDHWLESEAPRNRARTFELTLAGAGLATQTVSFELPEYPETYSQSEDIAIRSFELAAGEHEIVTTLKGLRAKLVAIDHLGNQRLRWHVELYNEGDVTLTAGLDSTTTKLLMGGDTYRLEATDTGVGAGITTTSLRAGERRRLWLEFAGSFEGDEAFDLILGSSDPDRFRYRLVTARLDDVAKGGPSASP